MEARTEYPSLLATLSPEQAVDVLNDRVGLIKKVNLDIADWLQERRKVEEAYVIGLRKLASRPQQEGAAALGIFQTPWQRIVAGVENLAASHEVLAQKMQTDVENPLRQFATRDRAMQAVSSSQGNFASMAKELGTAQKKADKLTSRGGRRADDAGTNVGDAARQWESQAPFIYEQLQMMDEKRINHLRDVLTQLQTHEVDQVERNRASAESCLNALLNVETSDEIKTFAAKIRRGGSAPPTRRRSSAAGGVRPVSAAVQSPPTPPPPRLADTNRRASSSTGQDRLAPLPEQQGGKSKLSGLKRLGTVMNRRKSTVPPVPPQTPSEKKKDRRSFAPFRRGDSSRSFQDLEQTGQDLEPSTTEELRAQALQPETTESTTREQPTSYPPPEIPPIVPMVNGTQPQTIASPGSESMYSQPGMSPQHQSQISQLVPVLQPQAPQAPQEMPTEVSPVAQAQHEAMVTSPDTEDSSRGFAIRDKPIQEDQGEAQLAMNNMASQLRMQAQTSGINRVQGSVRGRRDVRNTMFIPSGIDTSINPAGAAVGGAVGGAAVGALAEAASTNISTGEPPADLASPIRSPPPRTILEDQPLSSDTQSVHSSHSLSAQAHHPELTSPGLSASIIETVNTWFSESGVTKSFVTGEIALSHNASSSSTSGNEIIRLSHFEVLEKVAANPIFVSAATSASSSEDTTGTYSISLHPIGRTTPMVGLKYQLHLEESNLAQYSPLLLTPAWQLIENQASVILLYSLNPAFTSSTEPMTLRNVVVSISLDPTAVKPQSAMMSPTTHATFRRKASSVLWRIPELVVKPEQERMLVRFMTPGGTAKKGSVEVKFDMPGRCASDVGVERRVVREKDPFADADHEGEDEAGWTEVETKRALATGRYTAS